MKTNLDFCTRLRLAAKQCFLSESVKRELDDVLEEVRLQWRREFGWRGKFRLNEERQHDNRPCLSLMYRTGLTSMSDIFVGVFFFRSTEQLLGALNSHRFDSPKTLGFALQDALEEHAVGFSRLFNSLGRPKKIGIVSVLSGAWLLSLVLFLCFIVFFSGCSSDGSGLAHRIGTTASVSSGTDATAPDSGAQPDTFAAPPDTAVTPDVELRQPDARATPPNTVAPDSAAVLADTGRHDTLPPDTRPALPDTADTSLPPDAYRPPPDAMPKDTFPDIIPCPYDPDKGLMGPVICDSPVFCGQRCVYYVNGSGKTVCTCGGCGTPSRWQLTGC